MDAKRNVRFCKPNAIQVCTHDNILRKWMSRDSEKEVIEKNKEAIPFWKKPSKKHVHDNILKNK